MREKDQYRSYSSPGNTDPNLISLCVSTTKNSTPTNAMSGSTKSNFGSRAMEAILTSGDGSTGTSPEDWQCFLIDTMTAISGPLARHMLDRIGLNAAAAAPFRLLDHGCGLGVVAPVLLETMPREVLEASSVICGDNSEALVETVRGRIEREGWIGCEARVVDAQVSVGVDVEAD